MRATVLQGPRDVRVEEVPDPVLPGPRGAVISVERTAICGSDLHLYHDAPTGTVIRAGDFLFPTEVMQAAPAPHTARSAKGGALVLVADRHATHELFVSCPPLLEILSGS